MLSSAGSAADAANCHRIGITRHLMKPMKGPDLIAAIRHMISGAAPITNLALAVRAATSPAAIVPARPLRILLAEDNAVNQRLALRLLEQVGHTVTVAGDGEAAVRLWEPGLFDLILMDVEMPVKDGFEATAAIRAQGGLTPIIALTAHAMVGDREKCLRNGMDGYLQKPIQAKELHALLDEYLGASPVERDS